MNSWIATGGPAIRGRQRWSPERQVRLAAGLLILISVVASLWMPLALFVIVPVLTLLLAFRRPKPWGPRWPSS